MNAFTKRVMYCKTFTSPVANLVNDEWTTQLTGDSCLRRKKPHEQQLRSMLQHHRRGQISPPVIITTFQHRNVRNATKATSTGWLCHQRRRKTSAESRHSHWQGDITPRSPPVPGHQKPVGRNWTRPRIAKSALRAGSPRLKN